MKIPVSALYENCQMMLRDRWGYIYGTAGVPWTAEKQEALKNKYSAEDSNYGLAVRYGSKWIGHTVTDCSGVMVYIWRQYGLSIPHGSSSMVRQGYIVDCGSTPHPGWAALVDPEPETPDNNHIGIVGEDGATVYEAKGTIAGFTTSKVTDAKWTKFGRFKDVNYNSEADMKPPYTAQVITNTDPLTMRSGPGTEYGKIGKTPKGQKVKVITHSDWDFVEYNGIQGYALSKYLLPLEEIQPDKEPETTWLENATLTSEDGCSIILKGKWKVG